jgi:hypothetical protein
VTQDICDCCETERMDTQIYICDDGENCVVLCSACAEATRAETT